VIQAAHQVALGQRKFQLVILDNDPNIARRDFFQMAWTWRRKAPAIETIAAGILPVDAGEHGSVRLSECIPVPFLDWFGRTGMQEIELDKEAWTSQWLE
jgi:hypothetical protein